MPRPTLMDIGVAILIVGFVLAGGYAITHPEFMGAYWALLGQHPLFEIGAFMVLIGAALIYMEKHPPRRR